nr:hypothetical protein [Tanacetum cinerariifolium]
GRLSEVELRPAGVRQGVHAGAQHRLQLRHAPDDPGQQLRLRPHQPGQLERAAAGGAGKYDHERLHQRTDRGGLRANPDPQARGGRRVQALHQRRLSIS